MLNDEDLLIMQRNNEILRLMNNIAEMQLTLLQQPGDEREAIKETLEQAKTVLHGIHSE